MKMHLLAFYFSIFGYTLLGACHSDSVTKERVLHATSDSLSGFQIRQMEIPYKLSVPNKKHKMPKELTEISAIAVYRDSKLVCVQDEEGKIFVYDLKKNEAKQGTEFGKKGDYEGIAVVGDTIYVLSSNGNMHQIIHFKTPDQKSTVFKTPLNEENDTEGLCYDVHRHQLLIACKNKPGNELKDVRAVYGFDLNSMQLKKDPLYVIPLAALKNNLTGNSSVEIFGAGMKNFFDDKENAVFQPSEIAIHPITGDVYLISSVGKMLVVLDYKSGQIKLTALLPVDLFKQPEGLCFNETGTLFICDEGRGGHGNILEFEFVNNHEK